MSSLKGKIAQVIGPVVDVAFEKEVELPKLKSKRGFFLAEIA